MLAHPPVSPLVTELMCGMCSAPGHCPFALSPCSSSSALTAGLQRPEPSVTPAAAAVTPTKCRRENRLIGPARGNVSTFGRFMVYSFVKELSFDMTTPEWPPCNHWAVGQHLCPESLIVNCRA